MSFHPHLLVADSAEGFAVFQAALAGAHPLVHAATLVRAKAALRQQPALVVCGCDFDEGGMYDLLRHLKSDPAHADTRFLAIRCIPGEMLLDDTAYNSVKMAVTALGGDGFVDYVWWCSAFGEKEAARRLQQVLRQLLAA